MGTKVQNFASLKFFSKQQSNLKTIFVMKIYYLESYILVAFTDLCTETAQLFTLVKPTGTWKSFRAPRCFVNDRKTWKKDLFDFGKESHAFLWSSDRCEDLWWNCKLQEVPHHYFPSLHLDLILSTYFNFYFLTFVASFIFVSYCSLETKH